MVAGSRMTLPITVVFGVIVWMACGLLQGGMWVQLTCFMVSVWLMGVLSNGNALIRIYSSLVSSAFVAISCSACFLFDSVRGAATGMFAILSLVVLFTTYQNRSSAGSTFYAFLSIGIGSLFCATLLYYVPVAWLLMATFLRSLGWRTLAASVFGVCLPYWFACAVMVYTEDFGLLAAHLSAMASPGSLCHYDGLPAGRCAAFAFILLLGITGTIHYQRRSIDDKIRTRMYYKCLMTLFWIASAHAVLLPQHIDVALRMMVVGASPLIAHFLALTDTRLTNAAFCAIIVATLSLTAFNLWMPSMIF